MDTRHETCPHCGGAVTPIVYGYPGPEMLEAAQQGRMILGGCIVADDNPRWQCPHCRATDRTHPMQPDVPDVGSRDDHE